MGKDLREAMDRYPLVSQQSNTFWYLTLKAHAATAVSQLCRAFDQEQKSLHLLSWLLTIRENVHLFSVDEFKKRLKDNPFVESLAEDDLKPDEAQLEHDVALCKDTNPLVRKLIAMRGSTYAHRSAELTRRGSGLSETMTLTRDEFEHLLTTARDILNRYTRLFAAESYSVSVIGAKDFEYIFSTVHEAVQASRKRTEELLRTHGGDVLAGGDTPQA
jgi:hypothetical protein